MNELINVGMIKYGKSFQHNYRSSTLSTVRAICTCSILAWAGQLSSVWHNPNGLAFNLPVTLLNMLFIDLDI
ncbi:hypothetical protein K7X08_002287 [Anisodus acutangulus]|uniref:Uncharacterized protein n=1 Tax=Anisodus acutangulus TaxID=402998 RepID=A0A9Q1LRJ7_9SOLA|nr:hypothetical protein K7X08_002287 [Anisodus acutangulus]